MKKFMFAVLAASMLFASNVMADSLSVGKNQWLAGTTATGATLKDGVLRPVTSGGANLGSASYIWSNLYVTDVIIYDDLTITDDVTIGGSLAVDDVFNIDDVVTTVISGITFKFEPTSSFMVLTSTEAVTVQDGLGGATISTDTASAGDYLVITSTATDAITFPTGTAHFVVAKSSPSILYTNDCVSYIFDGNYWVQISSSVNN